MFQIMTVHVFDFTMLLEERIAGGREGEWDLNSFGTVLNMAPRWDSNQGQKKKGKKMQANINSTDPNCLLTHTHVQKNTLVHS